MELEEMYISCEKCKYNKYGGCNFYLMGSGNKIDMPCYREKEVKEVLDNLLRVFVEAESETKGTILDNEQKTKKEALLEELAKEDLQVLSLAYMYVKNMQMYGEDVTKDICSATENAAIIEKAYRKGYYDAMNRVSQMEKLDVESEDKKE